MRAGLGMNYVINEVKRWVHKYDYGGMKLV